MKNLFETSSILEIKDRIQNLKENGKPVWGEMTTAQMMAHCSKALENALGESYYNNTLLLKIWAFWNKSSNRARYLSSEPFQPSEAIKSKSRIVQQGRLDNPFRVAEDRDFETEKEILIRWIDRFYEEGKEKTVKAKHPSFGMFTPSEWAIGQYKHLDYHLRQFGV